MGPGCGLYCYMYPQAVTKSTARVCGVRYMIDAVVYITHKTSTALHA
jgi:hypothetical protein